MSHLLQRGRVAKLNENHPLPGRAKATKVGAALGLLHLGSSLIEGENDGVWKVHWQLSDPCGRDFLVFYSPPLSIKPSLLQEGRLRTGEWEQNFGR